MSHMICNTLNVTYHMTVTLLLFNNINGITDNINEIVLKAGTADERTVYVGMRHKLRDVRGSDAASIEDAQSGCCFSTIHVAEEFAYLVNDFPCSFSGGGFAGADGPDGFIGDDNLIDMLCWKVREAGMNLMANHLPRLVRVVLRLVFADTDNGT